MFLYCMYSLNKGHKMNNSQIVHTCLYVSSPKLLDGIQWYLILEKHSKIGGGEDSYWTDVSSILNKTQIIHHIFINLFEEQQDWTMA